MKLVVPILVCLLVFAPGCLGGDDDDEERDGQATGTATDRPPKPPLAADWYEDPDDDAMPTAVEKLQGTDPNRFECLEKAEACPGITPEGALEPEVQGATLLMLDSSGSMAGPAGGGQTKLDAAREAIRRYAAATPESFERGFMVFGHKGTNQPAGKAESCRGVELLQPIDKGAFRSIPRVLDDFRPTGYTPLGRALGEARAAFAGREGAGNRVVLITDGIETCGGKPVEQARRLKRSGIEITVDVVGFDIAGAVDRRRLAAIARAGGGRYYDAQTADDLDRVFESQLRRFRGLERTNRCVRDNIDRVGLCQLPAVDDALAEMIELESEARSRGEERKAEELDRLAEEMREKGDRFIDEHFARLEAQSERLSRETDEALDRLIELEQRGQLPRSWLAVARQSFRRRILSSSASRSCRNSSASPSLRSRWESSHSS
jgi:von Willebrand factor type A domain